MEKSNNSGKVIGALLVGAAIGGALGILFAPEKGSTTRTRIMDEGNDMKDMLADKFDGLLYTFKKELEQVKDRASEFASDVKFRKA